MKKRWPWLVLAAIGMVLGILGMVGAAAGT